MKKTLVMLLTIVMALWLAFPAFAATYYVDFAAGSDTNAGTQASPWRHLPGTRNTGNGADISTCWG